MCLKTDRLMLRGSGPEISWTPWTAQPACRPRHHTLRSAILTRCCVRNLRNGSQKEIVIEVPKRKGTKQRPPIVEPKSPIHAKIGSKIGLLKIPYFPGAMGMGFAKALDNAVRDLKQQGCERLIVDLRGNIGGSLGFARLASYMCPGQIAIGHSLTPSSSPKRVRSGGTPTRPDAAEQSGTFGHAGSLLASRQIRHAPHTRPGRTAISQQDRLSRQ